MLVKLIPPQDAEGSPVEVAPTVFWPKAIFPQLSGMASSHKSFTGNGGGITLTTQIEIFELLGVPEAKS
jgi:hypothetical protein